MSSLTYVTELIRQAIEKLNAWETNAKKIDELDSMDVIDPAARVHVSIAGVSKRIDISQLLESVANSNFNQLLSIGTISVVDNEITIPAGAIWTIGNVNYTTSADTVITVPYAVTDLSRTDIIVANTSGQIVLIQGIETAGIAVRPNIPADTVLVTQVDVTDASIGDPSNPIVGSQFIQKAEYFEVLVHDIGNLTLPLDNLSTSFRLDTVGVITVDGFSMTPTFVSTNLWIGKKIKIVNNTGSDFDLAHDLAGVDLPMRFPNGDYTLKNNYSAVFEIVKTDVICAEFAYVNEDSVGFAIPDTDALSEGSTNLFFTSARVLATVLSGISLATGGAIVSTDTILQAFGKIQKQINDLSTVYQAILVSGTNIKTINSASILGSGNLAVGTSLKNTNITTTDLSTQDVDGFVVYINALGSSFAVAANEIQYYTVTDSGMRFMILLNGRSFGGSEPDIVAADVLEVEPDKALLSMIPVHETHWVANTVQNNMGFPMTTAATADDSGTGPTYGGNAFGTWPRRRYVSAATAGASIVHNNTSFKMIRYFLDSQFHVIETFGHEDAVAVPTARTFYGFAGSPTIGNVDPSTITGCFALANDSGDANFQAIHNDASGTCTKVSLGASFPAQTVSTDYYRWEYWKYEGSMEIHYKLYNRHTRTVIKGKATSNLPPAGIYYAIAHRNNGSTAAAVRLSMSHHIIKE